MDPHQPPNRPANRISLVDLATEIAVRKRSPLQLPPALGHVSFTLVAQLVGVSARFLQVRGCVGGPGWRHLFRI
jgi:hypothetical protein